MDIHGADKLEQSARELARKIAAELPEKQAALRVRNLSSLPAADADTVRRVLENELRARGIQVQEVGASQVQVTLSESIRGYLLVAEIQREDAHEVALVEIGRWPDPPKPPPAPALALQKELIFEQAEPILDFHIVSGNEARSPELRALTPTSVSFFVREGEDWRLRESRPIVRTASWPRDVRGHLERAEPVVVYLPGMRCAGEATEKKLQCLDDRSLWPLSDQADLRLDAGPAVGRNLFDRSSFVPRGESSLPPFFTGAVFKPGSEVLRAFAGVDGNVRVYRDDGSLLVTIPGWGSDLASIRSGCGTGWQLLATRPGDWTRPDALQAYEVSELEAVAVSAPVEFPGPVTALWSGSHFEYAIAAVRNLKTGRYEGYRLSISCGR